MNSVNDFLNKAADRNGFMRDRFEEKKIPTEHANLTILPFFGDYRGLFILSSLLLKRYQEEVKPSKYFILASWPQFQGLFPYVDEYWSLTDHSQYQRFFEEADGFRNRSDLSTIYFRNLNEFFRDVIDWRELTNFYDGGIKQEFFDTFKTPKRFLPFVPSASVVGREFSKELAIRPGYKIFIHPTVFGKQWGSGKARHIRTKPEFWSELVQYLLKNNFVPVIWQNRLTYDLSPEFTDKCLFLGDIEISRVLAAMRATGCVLDVFNGLSRLAIAARTPFLAVDERIRSTNLKEYEIDDLCGPKLPMEYIFTFSTIISDGHPLTWNHDIFPCILKKLEKFMGSFDREQWPSTAETWETVSYKETVRKIMPRKFGTKLLKVPIDY